MIYYINFCLICVVLIWYAGTIIDDSMNIISKLEKLYRFLLIVIGYISLHSLIYLDIYDAIIYGIYLMIISIISGIFSKVVFKNNNENDYFIPCLPLVIYLSLLYLF